MKQCFQLAVLPSLFRTQLKKKYPCIVTQVKTETLLEEGRTVLSDNISDSSSDRDCKPPPPLPQPSQVDAFAALSREHLLHGNGLHHVREHEALQVSGFCKASIPGSIFKF